MREEVPKAEGSGAITEASSENKNIALAVDLAEKMLRSGDAPTAVVTHYLRLGTEREKLARAKLEAENEMLKAKSEALHAQARGEEMYQAALKAFATYSGDEDYDE